MVSRARCAVPNVSRRGFTLPEMLIVIVMICLIALVGLPKFTRANARRYMNAARQRTSAALVTARQAAIQKGRAVEFKVVNNRVTVTAGGVNLISPQPLDTLYRVRASPDSLSIIFNGRGFTTIAADTTIRFTRPGTVLDSVHITRWGMIEQR